MRYLLITLSLLLAACTAEQTPPMVSIPVENPFAPTEPALSEPTAASQPTEEDLKGKSPAAIQALIGEPTLARRDDSVQIMLFENTDCVLEIIYREPGAAQHFQAEHIAARNTQGQNINTTECLSAVYNAHTK